MSVFFSGCNTRRLLIFYRQQELEEWPNLLVAQNQLRDAVCRYGVVPTLLEIITSEHVNVPLSKSPDALNVKLSYLAGMQSSTIDVDVNRAQDHSCPLRYPSLGLDPHNMGSSCQEGRPK